MNGCLRIYTEDRSAMIFYKDGNPLGFFHDGSHDIETSSSESQKIAGMPGAKIDLYSTQGVEELMGVDLLEVANIQSIWESCVARHQSDSAKIHKEREERDQKTVSDAIGRAGGKGQGHRRRIHRQGWSRDSRQGDIRPRVATPVWWTSAGSTKLLNGIERAAKLLISGTNNKLMMQKLTVLITTAKSEF